MKFSKIAPILLILTSGIILFWVRNNNNQEEISSAPPVSAKRGLNRNPQKIVYSQHARCRMQCRHITEAEVREVLEEGKVNYRKSDLQKDECHKRYAVEDVANGQRIRIVVAQCAEELTLITCIDLDKDWSCECPGD